ncbi:unnamed protein product, partial [Rangifer tarandus platyrhynchus]
APIPVPQGLQRVLSFAACVGAGGPSARGDSERPAGREAAEGSGVESPYSRNRGFPSTQSIQGRNTIAISAALELDHLEVLLAALAFRHCRSPLPYQNVIVSQILGSRVASCSPSLLKVLFGIQLIESSISFRFQKRERSRERVSSTRTRFAAVGRALCLPLPRPWLRPERSFPGPRLCGRRRPRARPRGPPGSGAGGGCPPPRVGAGSSGSAPVTCWAPRLLVACVSPSFPLPRLCRLSRRFPAQRPWAAPLPASTLINPTPQDWLEPAAAFSLSLQPRLQFMKHQYAILAEAAYHSLSH